MSKFLGRSLVLLALVAGGFLAHSITKPSVANAQTVMLQVSFLDAGVVQAAGATIGALDAGSFAINGNAILGVGTTCAIANSTTCTATVPAGSHCVATQAGVSDAGVAPVECSLSSTTLTCTVGANTTATYNIVCE